MRGKEAMQMLQSPVVRIGLIATGCLLAITAILRVWTHQTDEKVSAKNSVEWTPAPAQPQFAPETDAAPDYAALLNREYAAGVTSENNAVVRLLDAFGPNLIDELVRADYFRALGVDPPNADGAYLQLLERLYPDDRDAQVKLSGQIGRAIKSEWTADEYPDLAECLQMNEGPLNICKEASRRERFFDPIILRPEEALFDARMELPQKSRSISQLLALRIPVLLKDGKIEEALSDSETIHRLSRLVTQHPKGIPQLVAYSHVALGVVGDAVIIQSGKLTAEQARQQRELIATLPKMPDLADITDRGERFASLNELYGSSPLAVSSKMQDVSVRKRFVEIVNDAFDARVRAMRIEPFREQMTALAALKKSESSRPKLSFAEDMFLREILPPVEQPPAAERKMKIHVQLALIGYALAEYRAVHGELPKALDALVPNFIETVPRDPYADGPIRYVVDEEHGTILLYSVGENGIDDGGRMDGPTKQDDIGFGAVPEK